jgi:cellulose synthase/poly-beta-1,6-N-acetylglucosamine synthase-like glycosyltransferase
LSSEVEISVFIPVYEGSSLLEPLLEKLVSESVDKKEIFVCIDKPNEESLKVVERFRGKVCLLLSNERRGKVEALNSAFQLSKGKILVFLDADVEIGDGASFLQAVRTTIRDADIVDFKKRIILDSFTSRMVNYEYIGSNFACYLFSKLVGKCFGVGGTAFAIRRKTFEEVGGFSKVVSEDLDLAVKALLKNKSYKYEDKVEVYTKAPSNWKSWLSQRKRWGIGTGLWIKEYWRRLVAYITKYPHVAFPCAVMVFPSVVPLLFGYMCSALLKVQFQNMIPAVLAAQFNFPIPQVVPELLFSLFFTCLTNFFLGFLAFAVLFYIVSRKLGFHFNIAEFLVYYFFYQPISVLVLFIGILRAFISKNHKLDWKV